MNLSLLPFEKDALNQNISQRNFFHFPPKKLFCELKRKDLDSFTFFEKKNSEVGIGFYHCHSLLKLLWSAFMPPLGNFPSTFINRQVCLPINRSECKHGYVLCCF